MLNTNFSYQSTKFISKGLTWVLVGSESNGTIQETIDTFKSEKGLYQSVTRKQIKQLCNNKDIIAI